MIFPCSRTLTVSQQELDWGGRGSTKNFMDLIPVCLTLSDSRSSNSHSFTWGPGPLSNAPWASISTRVGGAVLTQECSKGMPALLSGLLPIQGSQGYSILHPNNLEMTQCDLFVNSAQNYTNQPVYTTIYIQCFNNGRGLYSKSRSKTQLWKRRLFNALLKRLHRAKGRVGRGLGDRSGQEGPGQAQNPVLCTDASRCSCHLWGQKRRQRGQTPIGASNVKRKRNKWTQLGFYKTQENPEIEVHGNLLLMTNTI